MGTTISIKPEQLAEFKRQKREQEVKSNKDLADWEFIVELLKRKGD